ncbi:MAG: quinolinate synthase NadA [Candidatus Aminicenantes bacterium]|nr:quinolinate synthase NadA [Candidatus Aminicenantes bacterium]
MKNSNSTENTNIADISARIEELKKKHNAVLIAHNYQIGEVQEVADFVGDSLELSQKAAQIEAEIIVFCGVHFMAETAAILSPEKTVLLPEKDAGCPMADMITAPDMREWKKRYPGRNVVCYVNTTAAVKAECDICCTSANAVEVVESLDGDEILFAPDKNLAAYVARYTDKKIIPWDGYCYVHNNIHVKDIEEKRRLYPDAEVWVHPECRPEVIDIADKVFSTGKMVKEARETEKNKIILGTEAGMTYRLKKENPDKEFYPAKDLAFCFNMKKIDLNKVLKSLEDLKYKVEVPPKISQKALGSITKMIQIKGVEK